MVFVLCQVRQKVFFKLLISLNKFFLLVKCCKNDTPKGDCLLNTEIFTDIECYYCNMGALGVKQIYHLKTNEPENGFYFCLNCGRHLYYKPEIEKRYA